ncbi:MAG: hypothetical protein ACPGGH_01530, partial [Chitinophagales bacterium]
MRTFRLTLSFCFTLLLTFYITPTKAQPWTEDFNTGLAGSYTTGTQTLSSGTWSTVVVFRESSSNSRGGSGAAARINDDIAGASLTTPALNTVGTVEFWYRELSSGGGTFDLQTSTDGTNFTTVASQAYSGTTYTQFSYDINSSESVIYVRILSDDNPGHLIIDDFSVTAGPSGSTATMDYYNLQWPANGTI